MVDCNEPGWSNIDSASILYIVSHLPYLSSLDTIMKQLMTLRYAEQHCAIIPLVVPFKWTIIEKAFQGGFEDQVWLKAMAQPALRYFLLL